jgi:intein/homing endonuclease
MVGDYLSDKDGNEILIESIEILTGEFTVFNLDVEENDLYVANGILTHNPVAK